MSYLSPAGWGQFFAATALSVCMANTALADEPNTPSPDTQIASGHHVVSCFTFLIDVSDSIHNGITEPQYPGDGIKEKSYNPEQDEYRIQIQGHADALISPDFMQYYGRLREGEAILITFIAYGSGTGFLGRGSHLVTRNPMSALSMVADLRAAPRDPKLSEATNVWAGVKKGLDQLIRQCAGAYRRVLDVAGDGVHNVSGKDDVAAARLHAMAELNEIKINGLPIVPKKFCENKKINTDDRTADMDIVEAVQLIEWYEKYVLYGPGAFKVVVCGPSDIKRGIHEKLAREMFVAEILRSGSHTHFQAMDMPHHKSAQLAQASSVRLRPVIR